jgi:pyruvate kinase, alpha/beta domain protein
LDLKNYIASKNGHQKVVAKIENLQAIEHLDEIIAAADGIVIARGDLSIEVPVEDIPILQKRIVKKCNDAGKFVIVATQILSSMSRNKKPSRAEVSDVANAILDGVDAIMLSNVSATGKYPVEAVSTLSKICSRTECEIFYKGKIQKAYNSSEKTLNDAVALSVADTALLVDAKLIVAFTESGTTAKRISKFRPCCPIAAVTSSEEIRLSLTLNWGVYPVVSNQPTSELDYVNKACEIATYYGVKEGENIIITGGNGVGNTNFMKVVKL